MFICIFVMGWLTVKGELRPLLTTAGVDSTCPPQPKKRIKRYNINEYMSVITEIEQCI